MYYDILFKLSKAQEKSLDCRIRGGKEFVNRFIRLHYLRFNSISQSKWIVIEFSLHK